jgi:pyridoxal phosphate enzyme (YggS family)
MLIAAAMDTASAQQRLAAVRAGIARAARLAQRDPDSVTLIAVSKTQPAELIRPLLEAGHRDFGENRVQEAAVKWSALKAEFPDVRLHLIGQLQSNKAAQAAGLFDAIHSIDRPSLVKALAKDAGRPPDCFLQVNLAEEPQKGGCLTGNLTELLGQARHSGLRITGLMCIPPEGLEPAPWFALLAELARRHDVAGLSMGMSGDYETAVTLGATHVRVGTALFGARDP